MTNERLIKYLDQENELKKVIGAELVRFAKEKDYPLCNPFLLHEFFNAFNENNVQVELDDKNKTAIFWSKEALSPYKRTYSQIVSKEGNRPAYSFFAFHNSACDISEKIFKTGRKNLDKKERDFLFRKKRGKIIKEMEKSWHPYFEEYQENMFLSRTEEKNIEKHLKNIEEPGKNLTAFNKAIRDFPIDIYQETIINNQRNIKPAENPDPIEIFIYMTRNLQMHLDPEINYPTQKQMEKLFIGLYMENLAEIKGYPTQKEHSIEDFISRGQTVINPYNQGSEQSLL